MKPTILVDPLPAGVGDVVRDAPGPSAADIEALERGLAEVARRQVIRHADCPVVAVRSR